MDIVAVIETLLLFKDVPSSVTFYVALAAVVFTGFLKWKKIDIEAATSKASISQTQFLTLKAQIELLSAQLFETQEANNRLQESMRQLHRQNLELSEQLSDAQAKLLRWEKLWQELMDEFEKEGLPTPTIHPPITPKTED